MKGTEVFQLFVLNNSVRSLESLGSPKNPRNEFILHFKRSKDLGLYRSIIKRAEFPQSNRCPFGLAYHRSQAFSVHSH